MPRPARPAPRAYVEDWTGDLDLDASLFDLAEVSIAHAFARNLREAMAGRSGREVGRLTGVDFTTINKILRGQTWPDMATIARLEAGLGKSLWPTLPSAKSTEPAQLRDRMRLPVQEDEAASIDCGCVGDETCGGGALLRGPDGILPEPLAYPCKNAGWGESGCA